MRSAGSDTRQRGAIVDFCRRLHARGWVANHDGNISVRAGERRLLCTPTSLSKAEVAAETIVVLDWHRDPPTVVRGTLKPP